MHACYGGDDGAGAASCLPYQKSYAETTRVAESHANESSLRNAVI
jgi:hypothetical protein